MDEEFVWEAKIGQVFTLSTQNWRIERITHNDVFVVPARAGGAAPPFWKAEENLRDSHFSERIAQFLEAADALQKEAAGHLPHRHHLLVEHIGSGPEGVSGKPDRAAHRLGRADKQALCHGFGSRVGKALRVQAGGIPGKQLHFAATG
ncbi:MAG: hypothetical protein P4L43_08825 [Syntrophobacteraceae bacterium]|nr:hypothetical protein [Syntrophobacteraceae bacterium]